MNTGLINQLFIWLMACPILHILSNAIGLFMLMNICS